MKLELPDIKMDEDELRVRLAIKLFEDGDISIGKAAYLSGYTESTFSEILKKKRYTPNTIQRLVT